MQQVKYQTGEALFREGDPSEHCYKIISGKVEIMLDVPGVMKRGRRETIAICGPGELIGEMSVIDGGPRSASVVAASEVEVGQLSLPAFRELVEASPPFTWRNNCGTSPSFAGSPSDSV